MEFDDTVPSRPVIEETGSRRRTETYTLPGRHTIFQKWLVASAFIGMFLLSLLVFQWMGMIRKTTTIALVGLIFSAMLIFFIAFKVKLNFYFGEQRLKLPILVTSLFCMLLAVYLDPAAQIIFTAFTFISLAYGMYRIPTKKLSLVIAALLIGFGIIISLHYRQWHNLALLKLEVMHLFILAMTLPLFVFQISKVQRLNRILHRASRKIKYIQEDAKRDVLIDCFNRRYMVAALEEQKLMSDEDGTPFCLSVIDLDHFKKINDELGHLGGDEVLRTFARIAQENVRAEDLFGRYGGEEFLLIFPATSLLPALNTSERIRAEVEDFPWDFPLGGGVSISTGVTQYIPGESVLELFSRADTAMYLAKQGGRNQVVVEEPVPGKKELVEIDID